METKTNEKIVAAVQVILNELNGGSQKVACASILEAVTHDHRTLQQAFWSVLLQAQMGYAESSHDLRNEQAVELAKAVKALAREKNLDYGLARF